MANVNLVKSIYTSTVVTSLGELAAADTAEIPGNAQIDGLTASQAVLTDTNKKLVSADYLNQAVKTTSSPTFAGATIGTLAGFLFGTTGVVSANPITWTSWSPTLVAGSGSPTTVSTSGYYTQIGKVAFVQFTLTITNATGASGSMSITNLPIAADATSQQPNLVREGGSTGKIYQVFIISANSCQLQDYAGAANAWTSGYIFYGMFIYRAS